MRCTNLLTYLLTYLHAHGATLPAGIEVPFQRPCRCAMFSVIYCPKLTAPDNGTLSTLDVVYNTVVKVTCNIGFKMIDNQLVKSLTCLDGSVWSDNVTDCQGTNEFISDRSFVLLFATLPFCYCQNYE